MVVPDRSAQSDWLVERETAGLSRLQSYKEESTMIDAIYGFLQGLGYGHPLHPPLTHLPMGLVIASFVFAVLSLLISQRRCCRPPTTALCWPCWRLCPLR